MDRIPAISNILMPEPSDDVPDETAEFLLDDLRKIQDAQEASWEKDTTSPEATSNHSNDTAFVRYFGNSVGERICYRQPSAQTMVSEARSC